VNINYCVRVPGDGRNLKNEFNILNDRGMLEKNKEAEITIEFIPSVAQVYDNVLVVDLEGVGQDMLAVPIRATCLVPKVRVEPNDFLDYETCFLRHTKSKEIKIINSDSLKAKFEIVPQDEQSKRIGTYEADIMSGVIEPHSTCTVTLKLRTEILNNIRICVYIKLEGHAMPVLLNIMAESIGPIVKVDRNDIDYGNVSVLKDYTERINIKNESKIPAEYTAFTKLKESVWKVVQRHGILQPDENKVIEVVCNADEVQKF
jgi:hydrocephalus-inducing protein